MPSNSPDGPGFVNSPIAATPAAPAQNTSGWGLIDRYAPDRQHRHINGLRHRLEHVDAARDLVKLGARGKHGSQDEVVQIARFDHPGRLGAPMHRLPQEEPRRQAPSGQTGRHG